jgi:hypothetical protein
VGEGLTKIVSAPDGHMTARQIQSMAGFISQRIFMTLGSQQQHCLGGPGCGCGCGRGLGFGFGFRPGR